MPFLLRVELPDVPGSLGRVATTIGEAGGDIEAIEIVEKRHDGTAVDDVLLEMAPTAMPDSVVSACNALDGVKVLWISRYGPGGNLFLDLEAVEELTADPEGALDRLIDLLPVTFRSDWAARVSKADGVVYSTPAAPGDLRWSQIERAELLAAADENAIHCGARLNKSEIVVIGRRGGPEFLDSEIARLGHLVGLAMSITRGAKAHTH
ncbi:ACT domain-containing protein [Nocardioides sp. CN2-186]|uniref:ACT domain-containing protein n=1 Tax=Nocardioides tweenelious TaxID=3156607 RepID=UPI0032B3B182